MRRTFLMRGLFALFLISFSGLCFADDDARQTLKEGIAYDYGIGVPQDIKKAILNYQKAAKAGNVQAVFELETAQVTETMEKYGLSVHGKDKAMEILEEIKPEIKKMAEEGNAWAMYQYARYFADVASYLGKAQDPSEALKWFRKAAEAGDPVTQYWLVFCYCRDAKDKQDYKNAVEWFRKTAEQGYVDGQYMLGTCYLKGLGVEQDYKEAAKWFSLSGRERGTTPSEPTND